MSGDINDIYRGEWLQGRDIPRPRVVTVEATREEKIGRQSEKKRPRVIVKYVELEREMIFNVTNARMAAKVFNSTRYADWVGKQLLLFNDENVSYGGEQIGGLRVKSPPTPQQVAVAAEVAADDVPF